MGAKSPTPRNLDPKTDGAAQAPQSSPPPLAPSTTPPTQQQPHKLKSLAKAKMSAAKGHSYGRDRNGGGLAWAVAGSSVAADTGQG